jgi:hypothetical protein
MENDNDLSSTIVAKSDQINASEIINPFTITVIKVDKVASKDQPVHIHSAGLQPFKPCLTMRRMLIAAWGEFKDVWVGRSMTLYCDPEVMWAGKADGGVRVSHVSHIDQPVSKMLAVTRGRKKLFTLLPLVAEEVDYSNIAAEYWSLPSDEDRGARWATLNAEEQKAVIDSQAGDK